VPLIHSLLARNWNPASSGEALTASMVANSVGTSTPLRGGRWTVVVMLSTPSVNAFFGITDRRNSTFPLPSLRVAGFSNPYA
jgi:hypothetical protein